MRGDWSDTGPNARPEGGQQTTPFSNEEEATSPAPDENSVGQSQAMVINMLTY